MDHRSLFYSIAINPPCIQPWWMLKIFDRCRQLEFPTASFGTWLREHKGNHRYASTLLLDVIQVFISESRAACLLGRGQHWWTGCFMLAADSWNFRRRRLEHDFVNTKGNHRYASTLFLDVIQVFISESRAACLLGRGQHWWTGCLMPLPDFLSFDWNGASSIPRDVLPSHLLIYGANSTFDEI
jgi:hypothetical protein